METCKAIHTRRTIKKYADRNIPSDVLFRVLDCGRWAPDYTGGAQSWEFIVVKSEEVKRRLSEIAGEWLSDAPLVVIVCANFDRARFFTKEEAETKAFFECVSAAQNILIAARDNGLGSACAVAFDRDRVREIVKAPEDVLPVAIISLGYPAEFPEQERDPLHKFIHVEAFGNPWPEELPREYMKKAQGSFILKFLT